MKAKAVTYRLGSNALVFAPGVVRWAVHGARFPTDRPGMVRVIADGWGVPKAAARKLVTGKVPYTVEAGAVVFTA